MLCPEYLNLTIIEQRMLIGSILHLMQSHSPTFTAISSMVRTAENEGLFEGVKILPPNQENNNEN